MSSVPEQAPKTLPMIQIDQEQIHKHRDAVVRDRVEATLNGLLDAQADEFCGARRHERSAGRLDTRAGHCTRKRQTKAGVSAGAQNRFSRTFRERAGKWGEPYLQTSGNPGGGPRL